MTIALSFSSGAFSEAAVEQEEDLREDGDDGDCGAEEGGVPRSAAEDATLSVAVAAVAGREAKIKENMQN